MSEQVNLRGIFESQIRNSLYTYLINGPLPLSVWDYKVVLQFVDEAMEANKNNINTYLYEQKVTLLNMKEHITVVRDKFLIPYLDKKRVQ
jgi:hypothetical protein